MKKVENYFKELEKNVKIVYSVAEQARKKNLDPRSKVEVPLATSLAGRVAGLISTVYPQLNNPRLIDRILELEKEHGALDPAVCLQIAEEIAKEKLCKFKNLLESIDAGIRVAFAYTTLGVVSSPIEGFTEFKLCKTKDGKDYFGAFYSGPIRSAGGTAAAFSLVIIDHLREIFGYAKYDPSEDEIKRAITELYDYHERITNLQYLPSEEEIRFLVKNLAIQINGDPSEKIEVSNYKDLARVETNRIRSGYCLILGEGLAQKAPKILKMVKNLRKKGFKLSDWDFLEKFVDLQKKLTDVKKSETALATYIKDLVAGRPVLGHPSRSGAFRLRYGRSRTSGYSALSMHPASMVVMGEFIGIGSQIKIERPTKGAAMTSCDSIDGPIVKMTNGSVRKINTREEAKMLDKDISEIIYIGDLLVPFGDFANRNHVLMPAGYVEQIWWQELKNKLREKHERIEIDNIYGVNFREALEISNRFGVGLHPSFIYYWSQISLNDFLALLDWLGRARFNKKILFPFNKSEQERFSKGKRTLELLGIPHEVVTENVILKEEVSKGLLANLGLSFKGDFEKEVLDYCRKIKEEIVEKNVLKLINKFSKVKINDKAGTFIGARMGRPEKAKLRKLVGSPHALFPVAEEGGRLRSVIEACNVGSVKSDFPIYHCKKCDREIISFICPDCGKEAEKMNFCSECKQKFTAENCPAHGLGQPYYNRRIEIKKLFDSSVKNLSLEPGEIPSLVKGVRGTSNKNHVPENLAKGILRALIGVNVNKDGTIRYDATELPITHFKPKEIGTGIKKLIELGYNRDIYGKELHNEEQILEIFPHDVILPSCPETLDEKADDIFVKIAQFIDLLLIRLYGLKPFYNIKSRDDLVGHLLACIAPHNCAGVVGRIIGFSKTQALLASPYMHAAMRRDCDGDEAAIMMLLDLLVNFSREYLPAHRGGTQDAPLVLNARIRAGEVDDMILDVDVEKELPFELYQAGINGKSPYEIKISQIKDRLGNQEFRDLWYEYETSDINEGVICSSYKKLNTMQEKVQKQMEVASKIRAVDTGDVARLIIDRHFIRDIRGNLRKFSQQTFRCTKCNEKYRRPLISGICGKCGGKVIFTISEGFIIKYLEPALQLAENYEVPDYIRQSLFLAKSYIESIFGKEKEKQEALGKWF